MCWLGLQMGLGQDLPLELQLRPSELPDGSDVPYSLLDRQLCLQDDHILRPIVLTCAKSQTPVSNVYRHGNTCAAQAKTLIQSYLEVNAEKETRGIIAYGTELLINSRVYRHGNTVDDLDVMEGISHHLSAFFRSR